MEKKNCFRGKREWIYWIVALIPFVVSFLYYPRMPRQVPTQWGWEGQIRGYSSSLMACFGIPAFMVIMEIAVALAFQMDPKKKNIDCSGALAWIVRWFMVVLGIIMEAVIVASGLGYAVDVGRIISMTIGLAVMVIGRSLPRCRYNFTMGIRTPWTLNDEENWNRTHQLAGYCWVPGGLLMTVFGYFRLAVLYFGGLAVIVLVPTIYSYLLYRKQKIRNPE